MIYLTVGRIEKCSPDKPKIHILCPSTWIHYILDGEGYFNGKKLSRGEAFITYKNDFCEYYPDKDNPWSYIWVRFGGSDDENILKRCGFPSKTSSFPFDYGEKLLTLSKVILQDEMLKHASIIYRESIAKMILSLNAKEGCEEAGITDEKWVTRAKEYIALNYHKHITVESIAAALYIDRQYLRNLFVKHVGMPTKAYLDKYRMTRAAELLEMHETNIQTIALSVGYSDALVFSKAFKKHYGVSPSVYSRYTREKT